MRDEVQHPRFMAFAAVEIRGDAERKWAEKFSATSLKAMSLYMTGYEKDSAHFLHAVRL